MVDTIGQYYQQFTGVNCGCIKPASKYDCSLHGSMQLGTTLAYYARTYIVALNVFITLDKSQCYEQFTIVTSKAALRTHHCFFPQL